MKGIVYYNSWTCMLSMSVADVDVCADFVLSPLTSAACTSILGSMNIIIKITHPKSLNLHFDIFILNPLSNLVFPRFISC
jgi:hypothetical protein